MLFADLVGFTSRAEQLDPGGRPCNALPLPRARAHASSSATAARSRSSLATRSWPSSALRSCTRTTRSAQSAPLLPSARRSQELNEQGRALDLHVRIGVTTGEARRRARCPPRGGRGDGRWRRRQHRGPPADRCAVDGILVDEATYRATERAIEYGREPRRRCQGQSRSGAGLRADARAIEFGVDVRPIGRTPLVGRERELERWSTRSRASLPSARPQLVTLVGVPGIGKTRLVYELFGRSRQTRS